MPIDHWMLFGTFAEQRYFVYPTSDTYRGVIINANMVAHAPDGLAAFLLERTNLTYLIDPLTHAFQHNPSFVLGPDGEAKSSIRTLAEEYDPNSKHLQQLVGKKPLLPRHLSDRQILQSFVDDCIRFQRQELVDAMRNADAAKYVLFDDPKLSPHALIAPYFYLTEGTYADWLQLEIECCRMARVLAPKERLYAGIVVSRGLLNDESKRNEIVAAMLATPVDGFVVWVDDFDEQQSGEAELRDFLSLAEALRANKTRDVVNLHGGYFSILAAGNAGGSVLSGVTHAPEFGEYRSVVPVGGGIPMARYYVPELHARVRFREALRLFQLMGWLKDAATFHANVCDCSVCVETLNGDPANFVLFGKGNVKEVRRGTGVVRIDFPTGETKIRCLQHYLQRKRREYKASAGAPRNDLLGELRQGYTRYEDYLGDGVAYLRSWSDVFERARSSERSGATG
jgi:hypothetical protein